MSDETAAAILTEIYFEHVPGADTILTRAGKQEGDISLGSADKIGTVFSHFLGILPTYKEWGGRDRS